MAKTATKQVSFDCNGRDRNLILKIVERADELGMMRNVEQGRKGMTTDHMVAAVKATADYFDEVFKKTGYGENHERAKLFRKIAGDDFACEMLAGRLHECVNNSN